MNTRFPDAEQYPADMSAGDKAILDAISGWRHEDREVSAAKHAENQAHMEVMDRELTAVAASIRMAFPDGDADGHRRYHEALIRKAEMRARFFEKLLAELVSKGLIALLIALGGAVLYVAKEKLTK